MFQVIKNLLFLGTLGPLELRPTWSYVLSHWKNTSNGETLITAFFIGKASDPQMANFCEEIVQPYLEKESEHILDKDISVGQLVRNHKP